MQLKRIQAGNHDVSVLFSTGNHDMTRLKYIFALPNIVKSLGRRRQWLLSRTPPRPPRKPPLRLRPPPCHQRWSAVRQVVVSHLHELLPLFTNLLRFLRLHLRRLQECQTLFLLQLVYSWNQVYVDSRCCSDIQYERREPDTQDDADILDLLMSVRSVTLAILRLVKNVNERMALVFFHIVKFATPTCKSNLFMI